MLNHFKDIPIGKPICSWIEKRKTVMVEKLNIRGYEKIAAGKKTKVEETDNEYRILRWHTEGNDGVWIQHILNREISSYKGYDGYIIESTMVETDGWGCRYFVKRLITINQLRRLDSMKEIIMDSKKEIKKWIVKNKRI